MTTLAPERPALRAWRPPVGRLRAALIGRADEAAWVRPAFLGVTLLAAVLYLWNLSVSGYANTYYSAAALAGSHSWSALFFGSFDAANFITVDKPPVALWLMGLSVRLFGLSSWSVLLPEALAGVASVAVLYVLVRRSFGPAAALIAALVMALTPAAVLMFRYNNPDALLTLLLLLAAWALLRALEAGRMRWVIAAAVLVGGAFLTKYLQAYLVLPAFGLVWLVAAPTGLRRRIGGLLIAATAVAIASGWWVVLVDLIPASARPFIGGSTSNSAFDLILGYDGLGRIFGATGPGGAGGGGGGFGGQSGLLRLFNDQFGGQVAWFIPFAGLALVSGLWIRRRSSRSDPALAGYLLWGGWLVVHGLVFSLMSGIIHSYYSVILAPAIAALVGAGVVDLWGLRSRVRWGGVPLAAAIAGSAVLAWSILERTPAFVPGLGFAILVVAGIAAVIVAIPAAPALRRATMVALALGLGALLAGPTAYAVDTMGTAYSGGDPSAGPATTASGPGGFVGAPDGSVGGPAGGARGGLDGGPGGLSGDGALGSAPGAAPGGADGAGGGGASAASALAEYLMANRADATWIVAMTSSFEAGSMELATGQPVMAMGGFSGGDPAPTVAELRAYVATGQLRYVLLGGGGPGGGTTAGSPGGSDEAGGTSGDATASARNAWITANCSAVDYAGSGTASATGGANGTLYDCTAAPSG